MPYRNPYNESIAAQRLQRDQAHVNHENAMTDNVQQNDVTSQLESMAMKHPEISGGNGYAAATLQDLGFEKTKGTTSKRRNKGAGVAGAGVAGAGVAGAGVAGAGADDRKVREGRKKRGKKKGGAHLTLQSLDSMQDNPQTRQIPFRQR